MANTRSAIKRMKQSEVRRQRNRATRSNLRSTVKAARTAVATPGPEAKDAIQRAIRTIDRAVTQGLLHRNTAARRKSALARTLNTLA
jgi:small subunit ribosomal protein S20